MALPEQIDLYSSHLVFSVPTRIHAKYQMKALGRNFQKYVLRRKVGSMPPLYEHEGAIGEKTYGSGGIGAI